MKNNNVKKYIAALLSIVMIGSGFTACSKNSNVNESPEYNTACVLVNGDNAIIFNSENVNISGTKGFNYLEYYMNKYETTGDNVFYNFEKQQHDTFINFQTCIINYSDKDELETKVKDIIGEDGQITYQEDYAKTMK